MTTKKITFDGMSIEVTEQGEQAILKLQGQLNDAGTAKSAAETQVATLTTQMATKDSEIVTLKQQLVDAKVTPQQMRDAAKAYARTIDQAKKLAPKVDISDSMDETAIRKAVVMSKLGDVAKDWTEAQYETSFRTLAADVKTDDRDPLRDVIADGAADVSDAQAKAEAAREKHINDTRNAYKTPAAAA